MLRSMLRSKQSGNSVESVINNIMINYIFVTRPTNSNTFYPASEYLILTYDNNFVKSFVCTVSKTRHCVKLVSCYTENMTVNK